MADTYTCPILGPLIPLFWISGDVSSGFQSQSGLPYSHCGGERNVRSLRSTSGATRCRPLDGKHCGAPTGFISCPRILLAPSGILDIHQNKDYGTWRIIYSGVAITRRGLSTISSIIGRRLLNGKGHLELITVNCFFAKCSLGGSANEPF